MFCVSFRYLVVGSFWIRWKLLSVINVCNFLEYSSEFMITIVFPLSPVQLSRSPLQVFGSSSLHYTVVSSVWFCECFLRLTKGLK